MDNAKLKDYPGIYSQFENQIKICIDYMKDYFDRINAVKSGLIIRDFTSTEKTVNFAVFDFDIEIRFSICAFKDEGLIKWYWIRFNPLKRKKDGVLLFSNSFDYKGNVDENTNIGLADYSYPCLEKLIKKIEDLEAQDVP